MKKIRIICAMAFVIMLGLNSVSQAKLNLFEQPRYVPNLSFYGDSGKAYKLADFKADMLIAVVWSRYCGPCLSDLKALNAFAQEVANAGIQVILISPESEWKSIDERRAFLKRFGAPNLVNYSDKKTAFMNGMGIMVTPTALLINRNGLEVGQITGAVEWDNPKVVRYLLKLKDKISSE